MRAKLRASLPFSIILFCGIIFRTVAWGALPNGYYWDEVSSGYESWSLALTGAESWGSSLPVYFLQQSGGQNVLYSYLNMPFIALFGPSMLGVRLLMLLLGIATLPLLYLTVKRWYGHTVGLTAMGLLAVLPWHVMLSRYGLESSLLPFVFLLAVYTIGRALMDGKPFFIISAGVVLALCVYAYAVVCVPIAVFVLGLAFVYRKQLREQRQYWLLALLIFILLDVPFGLFLAQNYLHLFFIAPGTLPFSIPALTANRLQDLRSTGSIRCSEACVKYSFSARTR